MPDNCEIFVLSDPTPEQIANAANPPNGQDSFDPSDELGSGLLSISPKNKLTVCGPPHDEGFVEGGPETRHTQLDSQFERDVFIVALAEDDRGERDELLIEARSFSQLVYLWSWDYWTGVCRNTDVTRAQGALITLRCQKIINCKWEYLQTVKWRLGVAELQLIGETIPYPEAQNA